MITLPEIVKLAVAIAYKEDEDQIVGRIAGHWSIAHHAQVARWSQMDDPKFRVRPDGTVRAVVLGGGIAEEGAAGC